MSEDTSGPQLPVSGNGNGDGEPLPVRINGISPIAGGLAGGITATLTGRSFQSGAEVYFGSTPSPTVTFISSVRVQAVVPAATQTGTVPVTLVNPDGEEATLASGFTYVTTEESLHAEVLGVTPLSILEDTETEVTVRGRNLISAHTDGLVALRAPTRVTLAVLNLTTSRDEATGIEELTFTVRVTAAPPLAAMERVAIQVLASHRPGAASDGVFESSRQLFIVLPRALPVTIAFTDTLAADRLNLVIVAGRNLEGCSLDFGEGVTVHMQQSEDRTIAGIVTMTDTQASTTSGAFSVETVSKQLTVRSAAGDTVMQLEVSVAPGGDTSAASSESAGDSVAALAEPPDELSLTLAPVPDQQMLAPTEEDSALFSLGGGAASSLVFDWSAFAFDILDLDFDFVIVNEVRLIPFFDGGGDHLQSPVLAQVGRLFRVRGAGLLFALRIEITIQIRVILIVGFLWDIWPFGIFNEFDDLFPWAIGSVVISFRVIITLRFLFSALAALVKPSGELVVIFRLRLALGVDFFLSPDGLSIRLDLDLDVEYRVNYRGVFPLADNFLLCDGRFQLASENGNSSFIDAQGGSQAFYFPHASGACCLPWDFDLELLRLSPGQPTETVQEGFRTEFCLSAAANPDPMDVLIVSNRTPNGFPPPLQLEVEESDFLRALARPVDETGQPIPGAPRRDLRDLGFHVEFFLASNTDQVLEPGSLSDGNADAILPGQNVIRVAATAPPRIIDVETGEELPFGFWPDAVLGFDIASFLARGLMPAVRAGDLPVIVSPPPGTITVEPTLAYWVTAPDGSRTLLEARQLLNSQNQPAVFQNQPLHQLERSEPFEQTPRQYVLAVKVIAIQNVTSNQTLGFTVSGVQMQVLDKGLSTLSSTPPLKDAGYSTTTGGNTVINRDSVNDLSSFFTGSLVGVSPQSTFTARIGPASHVNDIIEIENLNVTPYAKEERTAPTPSSAPTVTRFVPPGVNVMNRHVVLSVSLSAPANANVQTTIQNALARAVVRNDETYEEYLRALIDAQDLIAAPDAIKQLYATTAPDLLADLTANGPGDALLSRHGSDLWTFASGAVKGSFPQQGTLQDDRQLYVVRLLCIGAIRAHAMRNRLAGVDDMVRKFELPSRGLSDSGAIPVDSAATVRRAVITGFDPFGTVEQRTTGNPSGVIALWFSGTTVSTGQPPAKIRTAIFPVRYAEFDAGWIENAVPDAALNKIVMLMTTSQNGSENYYDIERYAAKFRVSGVDNDNKNPRQQVPGTAEFLESTLPYEKVIKPSEKLPGPQGDAPFVLDQSYSIDTVGPTVNLAGKRSGAQNLPAAVPGQFHY